MGDGAPQPPLRRERARWRWVPPWAPCSRRPGRPWRHRLASIPLTASSGATWRPWNETCLWHGVGSEQCSTRSGSSSRLRSRNNRGHRRRRLRSSVTRRSLQSRSRQAHAWLLAHSNRQSSCPEASRRTLGQRHLAGKPMAGHSLREQASPEVWILPLRSHEVGSPTAQRPAQRRVVRSRGRLAPSQQRGLLLAPCPSCRGLQQCQVQGPNVRRPGQRDQRAAT